MQNEENFIFGWKFETKLAPKEQTIDRNLYEVFKTYHCRLAKVLLCDLCRGLRPGIVG